MIYSLKTVDPAPIIKTIRETGRYDGQKVVGYGVMPTRDGYLLKIQVKSHES